MSAVLLAGVLAALVLARQAGALKPAPPAKPPAVSTGSATDVSDSTVGLTGMIDPRGLEASCYFQYGLTTAYGAQTPTAGAGAGTTRVKVTQALSGLQLGTTYHYRLVATSSAGTSVGVDRTFTTKQVPLKFVITSVPKVATFGRPFSLTGTLSGTGGANQEVVLEANPFPYLGNYASLGKPAMTNSAGDFSIPVPGLSQTTELRVSTTDVLPTYGPSLTVRVAAIVAIRAYATGRTGFVGIKGTVRPSEPGAPVELQLVRSGRGSVKVGSATARGDAGGVSRFSALVETRRTGHYRAEVKVTNGRQVSAFSSSVFLRGVAIVHKPRRAPAHRR